MDFKVVGRQSLLGSNVMCSFQVSHTQSYSCLKCVLVKKNVQVKRTVNSSNAVIRLLKYLIFIKIGRRNRPIFSMCDFLCTFFFCRYTSETTVMWLWWAMGGQRCRQLSHQVNFWKLQSSNYQQKSSWLKSHSFYHYIVGTFCTF